MRRLGLVLAACMIAAMICGCGNARVASEASSSGSEADTAAAIDSGSEASETADTARESGKPTYAPGESAVSTLEELKTAATDAANTKLHIAADISIPEQYSLERAGDLEVVIDEGVTLSVNGEFEIVNCILSNNGSMAVSGVFVYGLTNFNNNGALTVEDGGSVTCGQSNASSSGSVTVREGAEFYIERGTIFDNAGEVINEGHFCVRDGGQLNDQGGSVVNNGTMDINSYYNGDITAITGTGTLNDNREQG